MTLVLIPFTSPLRIKPVKGYSGTFTENFTTTIYEDSANTSTVGWGSPSGVIKLPPRHPELIAQYNLPGDTNGVAIDGNYAYIADGNQGLQILNITDPSTPVLTWTCNTSGFAQNVAVSGHHAFIADGDQGLQIVDIVASPTIISTYDTPGTAYDVFVDGNIVFVTGYDGGGIQIINITDAANPSLISAYNTAGNSGGIEVAGDYAYLVKLNVGLQIINIANPRNPILAGTCSTSSARDVAVAGDYAFIADDDKLQVADISNPSNPILVGSCDIGTAWAVEIKGNYAYTTIASSGMSVVEISDPVNPIVVDMYSDVWTPVTDLAIEGNCAYITDTDLGLQIVKISDPVPPSFIGTDGGTSGLFKSIVVDGDYAYVCSDSSTSIKVLNIENPVNPIVIGSCDTSSSPMKLTKHGNHLLAASRQEGLQIIDISDPTNPILRSSCLTANIAQDVVVSGNYAYLADYEGGLQVINITDLNNPVLVGSYTDIDYAFSLDIAGNYAYVVDDIVGIRVVNITDPTNPELIGSLLTSSAIRDIRVVGDYAYVADWYTGLQVFRVQDPANDPVYIGSYNTPDGAQQVTVDGDYAYIGNYDSGMFIINITNPYSPTLVEAYDTPGYAFEIAIDGDFAFIADQNNMQIIEVKKNKHRQYLPTGTCQSTTIYSPDNATFVECTIEPMGDEAIIPIGTSISFFLSADAGTHWEEVTVGIPHTFLYLGSKLRWRAIFTTSDPFKGPTMSLISFSYKFVFNPPISLSPVDETTINYNLPFFEWESYADATDYIFQLDSDSSFLPPVLINETTSVPSYMPSISLSDGIWYWRIAAIDSTGDLGLFTSPNSLLIDTSPPNIDHPNDISYEQGSTANNITWSPSDITPTYYNITRNGELVVGDTWDGAEIFIDINGLARGSYTYVCNVYDYFYTHSSDTVIVTVNDTTSPIIDNPNDVDYEESSTGNTIIWIASDYNPNYFNVTLGNEFYVGGGWDGNPIEINVDGLKWGTYTFNCFVYDLDWNEDNDSVKVSVLDVIPPVINPPSNQSIFYGDTGESLLWTGSDAYPSSYTVYRNGTIYKEGEWTNTVFIWLDWLDPGLHNFTCVVTDGSGLTASSEVWVTVYPPTPDVDPPTISHPEDLILEKGSIGYSIMWSGSDNRSPWWAIVTQNETIIYDQAWFGNEIIISLDGLPVGITEYKCTLFDETGNSIFDIVNITVYPRVPDSEPPFIVTPELLEYEEGTEGHYLTWICHDDHPYAYKILFNDKEVVYAPWHGGNITVCVDGLTIGLWYINLTVWDLKGNNNSTIVLLTVIPPLPDEKSPIVNQPAKQNIGEGARGIIIWEVSDEHPGYYLILKNGTVIFQSSYWESGLIRYSFDSLSVGIWLFNLTLWDLSGNSASSIAIVMVVPMSELDMTAPEISQPPDQEFNLGSTGNSLQFHLYDEHPSYYKILLNNHQILKTQWKKPNQQVNISLDELSVGLYTVNLTAWDLYANTASKTVTVTVIGDITPPTIDNPPDVSISEGEDIEIIWEASDPNPSHFVIILIINGEEIANEIWDGQSITFIFSNLTVGSYDFRCIVYDTFGNLAFDDITITITESRSSPGFDIFSVVILLLVYFSVIRTAKARRRFIK
ncbi:MAG: Ig-like domain-containing protein [Promethearchaeota archaeon]